METAVLKPAPSSAYRSLQAERHFPSGACLQTLAKPPTRWLRRSRGERVVPAAVPEQSDPAHRGAQDVGMQHQYTAQQGASHDACRVMLAVSLLPPVSQPARPLWLGLGLLSSVPPHRLLGPSLSCTLSHSPRFCLFSLPHLAAAPHRNPFTEPPPRPPRPFNAV